MSTKNTTKFYQGKNPRFDMTQSMRCKLAIQRRILQLCDDRNLSLNALSTVSGITQSTLNNIVSGRNNSTNVSTVLKICNGLNMTLPEFFDSDFFRNLDQEIC